VAMARAKHPRGPYEPAPHNPILTHRGTDRPIQSTGHADLVSTPDGEWYMVLLATRPRGFTPGYHPLGRETFLKRVEWVDGWPQVDPVELTEDAPTRWHPLDPPPARDDFTGPALAPEWISPRGRPDSSWSLTERPGWLTLHATGASLDEQVHTFVGRRPQHQQCRVRALLDPGSARAGLSVRLDETHHYDIEVAAGRVEVIARIGPLRQVMASADAPSGPVTLGVTMRLPTEQEAADGFLGPDLVGFEVDGTQLCEIDGRYLSTEVATGFTGRVIGMYVTEGTASFDWFEYLNEEEQQP
ncbi:MAG: family 43 glycosylhydrolase, partial [Saccharothrix sp.]|nr:family 43 glycosylhydrolase [Saccharothrix sp.]